MFYILQPTMLLFSFFIVVAIFIIIFCLALIINILEWTTRGFLFWKHL